MTLTLKQRLWAEYYIGDANGNGAEAARLAGYKDAGDNCAHAASENLANPEIAALVKQRVDAVGMEADEVLRILATWARYPIERLESLGKDAKITGGDVIRALELLGKRHRLWIDRTETQTTEHKRIEIISIEVVAPSATPEVRVIDGTAREI